MSDHKYRWIVLSASLASVICLAFAFARYSNLAAARDWNLGTAWILWALVPGGFCIVVWLFQKRDWLRIAGVVSTGGILAYSVMTLLGALTTDRLGGDMGFMIELEGFFAVVVALGWSILALLVGWFGGRSGSRDRS